MKAIEKIRSILEGVSNPIRMAAEALDLSPADIYQLEELSDLQVEALQKALQAHKTDIPLARVFHRAYFHHLALHLSPATFQPRPETEALVDYVIDNLQPMRILDVCTGTGAILLSILNLLPNATGIGTDISPFCIANARLNAESLGLQDRAEFVQTSFTENLPAEFDLMLSNPPYVSIPVDRSAKYDPPLALYENGAYEVIILNHRLKVGGYLILEVPAYRDVSVLLYRANFTIVESREIGSELLMVVARLNTLE